MADNLDKQTNAWSAKELAQDFKGWYAQAVKDQDFNNGYNEKPQLEQQGVAEGHADPAGSWVVYGGNKVVKFKTHGGAKAYAEKSGGKVASSEFYADKIQKQGVSEAFENGSKVQHPKYGAGQVVKVYPTGMIVVNFPQYLDPIGKKPGVQGKFNPGDSDYQSLKEAETDYSKRRQRERDVDAGRPVKPLPKNPQTDYARKRAKEKRDLELFGEDSSTSSDAVERAILNRIMVAHTDLLKQFGPQKVMQAAEEVAYNVGDVDEIGTSDVSAYVHEVKQILGAV